MLDPATHIFWEAAAVPVGLFLLAEGIWTFRKFKKDKTMRTLAVIRAIIGLGTAIIDGLFFLPSWF